MRISEYAGGASRDKMRCWQRAPRASFAASANSNIQTKTHKVERNSFRVGRPVVTCFRETSAKFTNLTQPLH